MCFAMTLPPMPSKVRLVLQTAGDPTRSEFHRGWHAACSMVEAVLAFDDAERMVSPPRSIEIVDEIGVETIRPPPLPPPETDDE